MKKLFCSLALVLGMSFFAFSKDLTLSRGDISLVFSGGDDFLFKEFRVGSKNILPEGGSRCDPWILTLLGPKGETPWMNSRFATYKGGSVSADGKTASFTWVMNLEGKEQWKVKISVTLDGELPQWRIQASLPEGWTVFESEFPRISVARWENAKAILPVGYGVEYDAGPYGEFHARYPSCTGGMQMVMLHNGEESIYFSSLDRDASLKTLIMRGEGNSICMIQKVPCSFAWSGGGDFSIPWAAVLGYNGSSWQDTAIKWYRPFALSTPWGKKNIRERDIPDWIENADLWLRPIGVNESVFEDVKRSLLYFGKEVGVHWYEWHNHPFDTKYPEYFPAKDGWKEMVSGCKALGAHVTPYTNARLWDPSTEMYDSQGGREASCRKFDGTLYTELYASKVVNTVSCPSTPQWRDRVAGFTDTLLNVYNTDGVYYDQVAAAAGETCYSPTHPHPKGGGPWWHLSYRDMFTSIRASQYSKDQAMTTEENAECYIDLFDELLIVNGPHSNNVHMVPLFPLIYSDRCVYSGYTYIPENFKEGPFIHITAKSLIFGAQLGWIEPSKIMSDDVKEEREFLKEVASFRKRNHDVFFGGRFICEYTPSGDNGMETIPSYGSNPIVMASQWIDISGHKADILVNTSKRDRIVETLSGKKVSVKARSALRVSEK